MRHFKKLTALLLAAAILFSVAGCTGNTRGKATTNTGTTAAPKNMVNIAALKGPSAMGMAKIMEDNAAGKTTDSYKFTLSEAPTDIVPLITTGAADIAALPLNVAATLFNKTNGGVQMIAIGTLGVLYVLEQGNTIKSVSDLKGKTIYSSGQAASPEYILNYILSKNGIDPKKDVKIEYKADHSELAALAASGKAVISVLPEPFVTNVMSKNTKLRIALDLTKEWEKVCKKSGVDSKLAMGCIIVRTKYAKENHQAVLNFLTQYMNSVDYVNKNAAAAAPIMVKFGIIPNAQIAQKAIPNCHISFIFGRDMMSIAKQNFNVLYKANPSSIGGAEPKNDFYYGV